MNVVEVLNNEYTSIIEYLDKNKQFSLSGDLKKYFQKVLILSSASYFEHEIQEILIGFISTGSNNNSKVISFFKKKAINMQYHTYFNWGEKDDPDKPDRNANAFFSLFGDNFKKECEEEVKENERLNQNIKSFLEIGHLRNILVHSNFAAAINVDTKTPDEIYNLFLNGLQFIDYIKKKLILSS
jgi:hypothetical protein